MLGRRHRWIRLGLDRSDPHPTAWHISCRGSPRVARESRTWVPTYVVDQVPHVGAPVLLVGPTRLARPVPACGDRPGLDLASGVTGHLWSSTPCTRLVASAPNATRPMSPRPRLLPTQAHNGPSTFSTASTSVGARALGPRAGKMREPAQPDQAMATRVRAPNRTRRMANEGGTVDWAVDQAGRPTNLAGGVGCVCSRKRVGHQA